MDKQRNQLINILKKRLPVFLGISFGIFLFILFFQPFPLDKFDFNDSLLFLTGIAAIVFIFMFLVRVLFPWLIENHYTEDHQEPVYYPLIGDIILLALCSAGLAFYLYYIGSVSITFYIMFKIFLICLAPVIVLRLYDTFNKLKFQKESLVREKKEMQKKLEKYEDEYLDKTIEIIPNVGTEKLTLQAADVVLIRSADNYVEIIFKEGETFGKKLLRNTLKNIEQQIGSYSNFIRCHRICIINKNYIEKLNRQNNRYWLTIKGYEEEVPVSRQYLLSIKEAL